jgi:NAD(P)-dependent dehydrogenase (short-subunit alcohol dehydrogenase family)
MSGRATCLRFLDEGARVVIADLNEATAKETLELAARAGHGDRVRFARTDVAEEADVEAAVALAVREFGRLDCVFNNAGPSGPGARAARRLMDGGAARRLGHPLRSPSPRAARACGQASSARR